MKLIICWSGSRSHRLAEVMHGWFPLIIDGLEPFLSSDIPKGSRWFEVISRELTGARAGLICLTPENIQSPWLHFEAGALARESQANHIYTYLYEVNPIDLTGPLSAFQSTVCTRSDTKRLIESIAASIGDSGPSRRIEPAFTEHWPLLEQQLKDIGPRSVLELIPELKRLFERKTFKESIVECTDQRWVDRYSGARQTFKDLLRHQQTVQDNARASEAELYNSLVSEVDVYAMDLKAHFLNERKFEFRQGKLDVPSDIAENCEKRRGRIQELVQALLTPYGAPVLDDARQFLRLNSFETKKTLLIHPTERAITQGRLKLSLNEIERCAISSWEFDRIVYYLLQEQSSPPDPEHLVESMRQEFEKLESKVGGGSLMPLHYSIRALLKALPHGARSPALPISTKKLLHKIEEYIRAEPNRDAGHHIKENVAMLLKQLEEA